MSESYSVRELVSSTLKGITPKYVEYSDIIVLNQRCIRDNAIDYTNARFHNPSKKFSKDKIIRIGDILINSTGVGTAGRCAFVKELPNNGMVITDSHVLIVRVNDFYTAGCLEYSLFSIQDKLQTFIDGSTGQGEFDKQILFNVITGLPDYDKRKAVYNLLDNIDKKIELNNQINAELEAMAKTLYDYWFVQFDFPNAEGKPYKSSGDKMVYNKTLNREIPERWENGTLDDIGKIVGGSTPSRNEQENFCHKGIPWITPNDLSKNQGNKFISRGAQDVTADGIKSASLKTYPTGTVLLSSRAPIGYMAIAQNPLTTNQGFKSFIPNKGYSTEFIYYSVKSSLKAIEQYSSGSTFKEISGSVLKTVKTIRPESKIVDDYTAKVADIFVRQNNLELENQQLSSLRDWLLPMLMNGQVTVK